MISRVTEKSNGDSMAKRTMYDVNIRSILSFREIGKGHNAMTTFSSFMNLAPPVAKAQYKKVVGRLHDVYTEVAEQSCKNFAEETRATTNQEVKDCQVSVDGTWQKRGHVSLNGVVTLLSRNNGKCLDFEVLSKKCKGCQTWEKRKDDPQYSSWLANHICQANHSNSSGTMERAEAVKMFQRSVEKFNLRYTSYIEDGDSSPLSDVQSAKPYGKDVVIEKWSVLGTSRNIWVQDAVP